MSAKKVNDRFIKLMLDKDPTLYKKVWEGGLMVIGLDTGELKIFFTGNNLSSEGMDKIMPVFFQAIKEGSEK